jgi:hypothetical protein
MLKRIGFKCGKRCNYSTCNSNMKIIRLVQTYGYGIKDRMASKTNK